MRQALLLLVALGFLFSACGGHKVERGAPRAAPSTVPAALLHQFDYDASAPLAVKEVKVEQRAGAAVHDLTYAGPAGRIDAYLVVPDGDGPFPAIEFMPGAPGARYTFLADALELAKKGIVSLLPDPPYARPPIKDVVEFKASDRAGIVQEVKEMRRGVDFLVSRPEVDPARLAYAGFSWGGSLGAIFSAVERRVHSFVLMSPVPRLSTDLRRLGAERGAGDLSAYERALRPVDAVAYLPHAAPSAVFLMFGRKDTRPSSADGHEEYAAASAPKRIGWYDAEHDLNDQAHADAQAWIAERLGAG